MLESFDEAKKILHSYHTGQVDLLKKKIRCLLFGQPSTVKKVMGVMLEAEDSNKGNFDDEEQKNLFARCFMEHVTLTLFFIFKFDLATGCLYLTPALRHYSTVCVKETLFFLEMTPLSRNELWILILLLSGQLNYFIFWF